MHVVALKTPKITPNSHKITEILDSAIKQLEENSVVAVSSKIVALCEGSAVPLDSTTKDELIKQEATWYLPSSQNPYKVTISVARHHLVASGGIDESNGDGYFVLWPKDLQASANLIREHLCAKHGLKKVGVVLTDSTTRPFQWGTTGIGISFSGFAALKSYVGTKDIFGRELAFQRNNIMNGLAAAAVLLMGEGNEQTPLAVITDVPFVELQSRNPTTQELEMLNIDIESDVYAPLLQNAEWQKGDK